MPQPALPFDIPEIEGKTMLELEELLQDNHVFADFFYSIDRVASIRSLQADIITKNTEIASTIFTVMNHLPSFFDLEVNLSKNEEITLLKDRIALLQQKNAIQREQIDKLLYEQNQELQVREILKIQYE